MSIAMARLLRRLAVTSLLAFSLCASAEHIPVESFFGDPDISFVRLSPSGRYVAMLNRLDDGQEVLVVRETADLKKVTTLTTLESARMQRLSWVNDQRLTFMVKNPKIEFEGNLDQFSIDRDGTAMVHLISGNWRHRQEATGTYIKSRLLTADYVFDSVTHDGSDDIVVGKYSWNNIDMAPQAMRLYRLNTRTLQLKDMLPDTQPAHVLNWILDAADQPRVASARFEGRCMVYYRAQDAQSWQEIENRDCYKESGFEPVSFDSANTLYVRAGYKGRSALFTYDLDKRQLARTPFVDIDGFDFEGTLERDYMTHKILGVHFVSDASSTAWFDPVMKGIQGKVDALLPGTVNHLECGYDCRKPAAVLVSADSDRMPTTYYVYTPATGGIVGLGGSRPGIDPKKMGKRDFFRFAARDGLQIPVYVTRPVAPAPGPLPTVVLVHGGPYLRGGYWEWDDEAQFLASRGYLVLQPEFRGSTGFGDTHFRAGWEQWGRTMQDDLADSAAWAIKQGWTDPKRIGIMGASYGGYATLMGLARNPELFRVGVEWVGVTDIGLLFSVAESDASEDARRYDMKTLIGDPEKNPGAFDAVSPLAQAGKITQPLLMAYGAYDRRVPLVHATRFNNAVKQHNHNVEYLVYPEQGHGWRTAADRIDFWKHVGAFLDKNL